MKIYFCEIKINILKIYFCEIKNKKRIIFYIKMELIPISDKEFRNVAKGSGIKYRNKIPCEDLKAMLGYCPLIKRRKVEVSGEAGF